jgi:polar amino acid transport system substrate-binding protein
MRKHLVPGVALVIALALAGCGSSVKKADNSAAATKLTGELKQIADRGSITVVTTNAIPFSYVTAGKSDVTGVARDVLDGFLASVGLKGITVKTSVLPFSDSMPAIQAGKADMILDAFYIREERKKIVDFTSPVINDPEAIVVKSGNPDNITTLQSLCGKKVGVNEGTAYDTLLQKTSADCLGGQKINVQYYKTFQPAISDVAIGRTSAMLIDAAIPAYALKQNPKAGFEFVADYKPVLSAAQAFIFPKGVQGILPEFDAYLKKIQSDGTMKQILNKWGMQPAETFLPTSG